MNNNNNSGYARGDSKPANVGLGLGYRKPPVTEDLIINNNRRNGEAHVSRNEAASGVYDELVEWHQGNSTMCSSNDNDRSGSLPEMAGTQPPSPVGVAQPEASARSGNNKEEERGQAVTMLYSLTSCPDDARHLVAGSKEVIEELTGHRADDYIDLFVAEEKWFNEEILIFALCLMNRITATHPQWFDEHSNNYYMVTVRAVDSEDDKLSSVLNGSTSAPSLESSGSDVHHHYQHHHNHNHNHNQQGSAEHRFVVPAVVTQEGTTNDRSGSHHSQDYASGRMTNHSDCSSYNASITTSGSRVGGAGGSCRWTPHNTPRCLVALLLLSAKFHGDIIYGTSTISEVAERVRARQKDRIDNNNNNNNNSNSNNRNSNNNNNSKQLVYPRLTAARLGECETRIWKELDCSVFVHLAEYEQCYEHVLAAAF